MKLFVFLFNVLFISASAWNDFQISQNFNGERKASILIKGKKSSNISLPNLEKYIETLPLLTGVFKIKDGRRIIIRPFLGTKNDFEGIGSMLSEEKKVYKTLRHLGPWENQLLYKTFYRYSEGVKKTLKHIRGKKFCWTSEFDLCFVIYVENKDGSISFVGRGGFQSEDSVLPHTTEIYFAIMPQFQNLGIGTKFALFLKELWVCFFNTNKMPLRGLYLSSGNPASMNILEKIGMKHKYKKNQKVDVLIKEWKNSRYNVMEYLY